MNTPGPDSGQGRTMLVTVSSEIILTVLEVNIGSLTLHILFRTSECPLVYSALSVQKVCKSKASSVHYVSYDTGW